MRKDDERQIAKVEKIEEDWNAKRCVCGHLKNMHWMEVGECFECQAIGLDWRACEEFDDGRPW